MHLFQRGITLRELGQVSESLGALSESAQIAFESGEPETEAVARLALLGVLYGSGRPLENDALSARGQLARAERVCRSSALRALLRLRVAQGALVNLRDQGGCDAVRIGALQLAGDLGGIAGELETLERHRDVLSAFLLQAEALLLAGRGVEAQGVLKESARRTAALGEPALGADLSGLPGVRLALSAASRESGLRALQAQRSPRLEVRVLGEGGLFLDGRQVRVGYRDAAEYILYLLRHPGVSSSELALALRPDAPARQTKVYLSALGHALAKTKLLKLHSSPATGVSLEFAQVELEVDLDTLEAHLSAGEVESAFALYRPLLPGGGEWAQREAERLARRVVGAGLLELTAAMASGEAQASCAWAERVHALDPFDPVLSAYLLEAVSLSQGEAPARMRAHQLQSAFMHEGLPLPQEVKSFLN